MFKRFLFFGTKKNDVLTGTDGLDVLLGKKGNDVLSGGDGSDFLLGGKGDDDLFGEDGNDKLFGGKGDDFLDGGAGSDYLFGGKGDDTFNFTLSENSGATDYYNGGKGLDTLRLALTEDELIDVQPEIVAFRAFLAEGGKVFHFESLGLTVRNFEDIRVEPVGGGNTAPVANPDGVPPDPAILVSEDAVDFSIDVLANDTDADGHALELVTAVVTEGGLGTAAIDGNQVVYNPGDAYQFLGEGASANVKIAYSISDGTETASSFVEMQVNGANDAPRALNPSISTTAGVDGRISVAVVGVSGPSSHLQAAGQLEKTIFNAVGVTFADATENWTADSLKTDGYEVVVLGGSPSFDYGNGVGDGLFEALNDFVSKGGGVVTTGLFASQLRNMSDPSKTDADKITPIAPIWNNETGGLGARITVLDSTHPIVRNLDWDTVDPFVYLSNASFHEFAPELDALSTPLATAQFGDPADTVTAIAYAEKVGANVDDPALPGGQTVYLGVPYVSVPSFAIGADTGVSDQIFEQAVAWAAGARSVNVTIDDLILLNNFTDVDSPPASLVVNSVSLMEANGATIGFDDKGDIVYSLQGQALEQFLANGSIAANFGYTVSDGFDTSAAASVSLTVNQVDIL